MFWYASLSTFNTWRLTDFLNSTNRACAPSSIVRKRFLRRHKRGSRRHDSSQSNQFEEFSAVHGASRGGGSEAGPNSCPAKEFTDGVPNFLIQFSISIYSSSLWIRNSIAGFLLTKRESLMGKRLLK